MSISARVRAFAFLLALAMALAADFRGRDIAFALPLGLASTVATACTAGTAPTVALTAPPE